jgi:hypothetical protein
MIDLDNKSNDKHLITQSKLSSPVSVITHCTNTLHVWLNIEQFTVRKYDTAAFGKGRHVGARGQSSPRSHSQRSRTRACDKAISVAAVVDARSPCHLLLPQRRRSVALSG